MIVCDLDLVCVPISEPKAYSPLIIDGDRVLTFPVSSQAVQTIARRNPEIIKARGICNVLKPHGGSSPKIRWQPFGPAIQIQILRMLVRKSLDHDQL
jgi:hypothetical protein